MGEQASAQLTNAPAAAPPVATGMLQRKCECGNHTIGGAECDSCRKQQKVAATGLYRATTSSAAAEEPPTAASHLLDPYLSFLPGPPMKLSISQPQDPLEKEADKMTDKALSAAVAKDSRRGAVILP